MGITRRLWTAILAAALALVPAAASGDGIGDALRGWNEAEGYQYVTFGRYEQTTGEAEPIVWQVLTVEKGRALLLSRHILDTRPMGPESKKVREAREQAAEETALAAKQPAPTKEPDGYVAWEESDLRAWLNSDFLRQAFTDAELAAMPEGGKLGQIFLPSRAELEDARYGFDANGKAEDPARLASGTRYANDHRLDIRSGISPYYTRTQDSRTTYIQIRTTGAIGSARYDRDNVGVRPALYVNLDGLTIAGGDGTPESPYEVIAGAIE